MLAKAPQMLRPVLQPSALHQNSSSPALCVSQKCAVCSGITTNFTKPDFPAGEIQPTDKTHLQVGF